MKLYAIHKEQIVPISLEQAWDFFSTPKNLSRITPAHMDFRILSELPEKVYAGQIIQYTVKPLPLMRMRWVTEITQVEEPGFFIDEQRFGPYAFWHHQHRFEAVAEGTKIIDLVHYGLPLGILGRIANHLFVKQQLNAIFEYRETVLNEMFKPRTKTMEV